MHSSELLAKFQDLRNETSPTSVDLAGLKASDKLTRYLDEALRSVVNEAEAGAKKRPSH